MSKCHIVGNHVSRLNCASTNMQLSSGATCSGLYSTVGCAGKEPMSGSSLFMLFKSKSRRLIQ